MLCQSKQSCINDCVQWDNIAIFYKKITLFASQSKYDCNAEGIREKYEEMLWEILILAVF